MKSSEILGLEKQLFEKKEITVTSGDKSFSIMVDTKFKETEMMKLVSELVERFSYCKRVGIDFDTPKNIYFLMVKHFTDIQFSSYKTIDKQYTHEVAVIEALINLGVFKQIIDAFDEEETLKIQDIFFKYKDVFTGMNEHELGKMIEENGYEVQEHEGVQ